MNINKIREALEMAEAMADVFDQLSQKLGDLRERNADRSRLEEIREAIAELDKAPKVLTDEEIERISIPEQWEGEDYVIGGMQMGLMIHKRDRLEAQRIVKYVLRYARDNGYLAPTAGLTVEETEQIAVDARIEIDEIAWKSPPISYEKEFRSILKRRLTAAIEAKTNSK